MSIENVTLVSLVTLFRLINTLPIWQTEKINKRVLIKQASVTSVTALQSYAIGLSGLLSMREMLLNVIKSENKQGASQ